MEMLRCQSCKYLQPKKWYSTVLKRICFFQKIYFKVKVIATEKHADLSNEGLFQKSLVPFFRRTSSFCWPYYETSKKKRLLVLRQQSTQILP